jgi:hypothetical protein
VQGKVGEWAISPAALRSYYCGIAAVQTTRNSNVADGGIRKDVRSDEILLATPSGYDLSAPPPASQVFKRMATQHDHRLLVLKPFSECQHDLEGFAADNNYIDIGIELLETVRLLFTGDQEIERVVWPSQKAIDAHSAED